MYVNAVQKERRQVKKTFFTLKNDELNDGIKSKETRQDDVVVYVHFPPHKSYCREA